MIITAIMIEMVTGIMVSAARTMAGVTIATMTAGREGIEVSTPADEAETIAASNMRLDQ